MIFFLFFIFLFFFIVIQLQLYAFSPHPSTPPQVNQILPFKEGNPVRSPI